MKKERGISGELKGLCSLFAAILPPLPWPGPPVPHSRGSAAPAVLGIAGPESAAASSGNRGPGPCGTLQGILAAIPSMAKELVQ